MAGEKDVKQANEQRKNHCCRINQTVSLLIALINRNLKTTIFAFLETTLKVIGDC